MNLISALLLSTLLAAPLPALAQQATPAPKAAPTPEADPDPALLKAMRSKVFEVKHRSPMWLANSLRALASGVRGARIDYVDQGGFNTITVRDFPENLAALEEAIKRLDQPGTASQIQDVEFQVFVLFASASPGPDTALPDDLQSVVKALKQTLAYKHYTLGGTLLQRTRVLEYNRSETEGIGYVSPQAFGPSEGKDAPKLRVKWQVRGLSLDRPQEGPATVGIGRFGLELQQESEAKTATLAAINAPISLKEGERIVVGTSVIRDRGFIVVLTAKLLK